MREIMKKANVVLFRNFNNIYHMNKKIYILLNMLLIGTYTDFDILAHKPKGWKW